MDTNILFNNIDNKLFPEIATFLKNNRDIIIQTWLEDIRIQYSLDEIGMKSETFKEDYAKKIFNTMHDVLSDSEPVNKCTIINEFMELLTNIQNASQLITLICTQFKNAITTQLFIDNNINTNSKIEYFSIISLMLDLNLSRSIDYYTNVLEKAKEASTKHARLLEESMIASKTDTNGFITFVSDSFCEISGYTKEELIGRPHNIVRHPDTKPEVYADMWKTIKNGGIWKGKLKNLTKDGKLIVIETKIIPEYNHNHKIIGYVAIRNDITDKIISRTDSLTKAMNRMRFEEKFDERIASSMLEEKTLTMILMDIDKFKDVNDTFGHVVGDEVLQRFSAEIKSVIRPSDVFARWGGEEFALLLYGVDFHTTLSTAERIRKRIETTEFETVGHITSSFGVGQYNFSYKNKKQFFENVDKCLYYSKKSGRNCISYVENGEVKIFKKD